MGLKALKRKIVISWNSQPADANQLRQSLLSGNKHKIASAVIAGIKYNHSPCKDAHEKAKASRERYASQEHVGPQHGAGDQQITVPLCHKGLQAREVSGHTHLGLPALWSGQLEAVSIPDCSGGACRRAGPHSELLLENPI